MADRMSRCVALWACIVLLNACAATGPKLESVKSSIPPLEENSGRLFFYREYSAFGAGMRPDILVCGKKVGQSVPGGVFYVDLPAGECDVTIPGMLYPGKNSLHVSIQQRGVQYIRSWVGGSGFGGRTNMELVTESTATSAMKGLSVSNVKSN